MVGEECVGDAEELHGGGLGIVGATLGVDFGAEEEGAGGPVDFSEVAATADI